MKYQCPNCGFAIFNRRLKKCESCGSPLSPELLYTEEQMKNIDAEFEANKRKLSRFRQSLGVRDGGGSGSDAGGGITGGGDCGGDGGGCD